MVEQFLRGVRVDPELGARPRLQVRVALLDGGEPGTPCSAAAFCARPIRQAA
jgi:hypothetical protein